MTTSNPTVLVYKCTYGHVLQTPADQPITECLAYRRGEPCDGSLTKPYRLKG